MMSRFFFILICGCMMLAATMTVQAQVQEDVNARYYREIQTDSHNGKYGLLFRSEVIVPYEYDNIVVQKDNRGFILQQGEKYGIIVVRMHHGENAKILHLFSQQKQYFFEDEGRGRRSKGINLSVVEIPCEYDEIKNTDGRYWVSKGDLKGVFNSAGGTILRCEFDEIKFTNGRYWVSKGDLKGVFNSAGGTILLREFNEIKFINGRYWVSKGNLKGVFNSAGGTILRCEFDKIELTSDNKYIAYKDGNKSWYNSAGGRLHTVTDVVYSTD